MIKKKYLINKIYKTLVLLIYKDVCEVAKFPLFIEFDAKTTGQSKRHKCIFLTKHGYLVVFNKNYVITAYFSGNSMTFQRSFIKLYNKLLKNLDKSEYTDKKYNRQIKTSNISYFSYKNWHSDPVEVFNMLNITTIKKPKPKQKKQSLSENSQNKRINICTKTKNKKQKSFFETIIKFLTFFI